MSDGAPIRLGVRGASRLSQDGLVRSLGAVDGLEVVAQAGAPGEGVPGEELADVCVLELDRHGALSVLAAHLVHSDRPVVAIADPAVAAIVLRSGATAVVAPDDGLETLARAIGQAAEGRRWMSPSIAHVVADGLAAAEGRLPSLSPRELEVLGALGHGWTMKEVAGRLGTSVSTVNTYRHRISAKLGIEGLPGLIRYAVEHGLVK